MLVPITLTSLPQVQTPRASEASEERPPKNISNPADRDRIRIRDYVLITRTGATTQHPPHGSPREPFVVQER